VFVKVRVVEPVPVLQSGPLQGIEVVFVPVASVVDEQSGP
jgi:hypothetical protein